jgi:hypothetical protein
MKHLHKFYGRADIPWVDLIWKTHYCSGRVPHFHPNKGSFWWKDIARLSIHFRGIASPIAGDDLSFVIWQDVWNNMILKMEFPSLYSFARRKNCSLAQFMQHQNLLDNFQSPLSSDAQGKFVIFQDKIRMIQGMMQGKDRWIYSWRDDRFRSSRIYYMNFQFINPPKPFKWIWKSKVVKKIKVFIWLMFRDRINSGNLLKRKGFIAPNDDYNCVLCNLNCEETTYHLLLNALLALPVGTMFTLSRITLWIYSR